MNHIRGVDREQTLLLPETIEDYVAADHPVRFIDAFVRSLDLHALGFAKAIAAYTGRPSYEPGHAPAALSLRLRARKMNISWKPRPKRVKARPDKMRQRKALVEHPFGTIKRWFGCTHFLVKGLDQVRGEWTLITLSYNLKRVLNLVSSDPDR